jgi:hypothetical protein
VQRGWTWATAWPTSRRVRRYLPDTAEKLDGILAIGIFSAEQIINGRTTFRRNRCPRFLSDELRFDSRCWDFDLGIRQALDYL